MTSIRQKTLEAASFSSNDESFKDKLRIIIDELKGVETRAELADGLALEAGKFLSVS